MRIVIECGVVRSIKRHDGLVKISVVETRDELYRRNGRSTDSWNVTVLNSFLVAECERFDVGDKLKIAGRAESNIVERDGIKQYFTEIIATDIARYGEIGI